MPPSAKAKRRAPDDSDEEAEERELPLQRTVQTSAARSSSSDTRTQHLNGTLVRDTVRDTVETSHSSILKGDRARKFQAIDIGFGTLGGPERFLMLNAVKCIGAGKALPDLQAADSFLGETTRMLFKADGTLDTGRVGAGLFPTCLGSAEGENDDESLDAMVAELAHGQRALLIGQSVSMVGGLLFLVPLFSFTDTP